MLASGTMPITSDVPATTYVTLLTNPGASDDISVAVVASYANCTRLNIASSSDGWNALANSTTSRQITNKLALNFGTAGSGPIITSFDLCKHAPGDGVVTVAGEIIYADLC